MPRKKTRRQSRRRRRGGSRSFTGPPVTSNPKSWGNNHYAVNTYPRSLYPAHNTYSGKGGGCNSGSNMLQDFMDPRMRLVQPVSSSLDSAGFGFKSMWNSLRGHYPPDNPNPTMGHFKK